MDETEFAELAAGAALNALSPADRTRFETTRREHPEWEYWVVTDADTAAALADAVPDALPPLTLRSTLLSRVAAMPQLPAMDAAAAAAAPALTPFSTPESASDAAPVERAPDASAAASDEATAAGPLPLPESPRLPTVDPAPTTTTIQAISRRNWTRGLLALAASLVLLVALGLGAAMINDYVNRPASVVALQQIEGAPDARAAVGELADGSTATAHWSESVGKAVLVSAGLPSIADDETFELWFVREDGAVSAGTFEAVPGDATTALLEGEMQAGDTIAVTVEPAGGAPEGQPTSDPILAIPTAEP